MPLKPQNPCGTKGLRMVIHDQAFRLIKEQGLAGACQTSPLNWWAQQGSNLRPKDYESSALTD